MHRHADADGVQILIRDAGSYNLNNRYVTIIMAIKEVQVMIQLPNRSWFIQKQREAYLTNVYSGSLGTDPQKGCMNKTTFNYKAFVKVTKDEGPVSFHVEYYWRFPWSQGGATSEVVSMEFDASVEGIAKAEKWLIAQCTKVRDP